MLFDIYIESCLWDILYGHRPCCTNGVPQFEIQQIKHCIGKNKYAYDAKLQEATFLNKILTENQQKLSKTGVPRNVKMLKNVKWRKISQLLNSTTLRSISQCMVKNVCLAKTDIVCFNYKNESLHKILNIPIGKTKQYYSLKELKCNQFEPIELLFLIPKSHVFHKSPLSMTETKEQLIKNPHPKNLTIWAQSFDNLVIQQKALEGSENNLQSDILQAKERSRKLDILEHKIKLEKSLLMSSLQMLNNQMSKDMDKTNNAIRNTDSTKVKKTYTEKKKKLENEFYSEETMMNTKRHHISLEDKFRNKKKIQPDYPEDKSSQYFTQNKDDLHRLTNTYEILQSFAKYTNTNEQETQEDYSLKPKANNNSRMKAQMKMSKIKIETSSKSLSRNMATEKPKSKAPRQHVKNPIKKFKINLKVGKKRQRSKVKIWTSNADDNKIIKKPTDRPTTKPRGEDMTDQPIDFKNRKTQIRKAKQREHRNMHSMHKRKRKVLLQDRKKN